MKILQKKCSVFRCPVWAMSWNIRTVRLNYIFQRENLEIGPIGTEHNRRVRAYFKLIAIESVWNTDIQSPFRKTASPQN